MKIPIYKVDAFTQNLFSGNPAAVCLLDEWLTDKIMQKIASENNLSETAFVLRTSESLTIRWFTPKVEVDLCGHATLASAHVLFKHTDFTGNFIEFDSKSGKLGVRKNGEYLVLNFPCDNLKKVEFTRNIGQFRPIEVYRGISDYLLVFENQKQIEDFVPDLNAMLTVDARGFIITAKGNEVDFVSRFFGPACGVNEDPVTGSAHTTLTPYWSEKLGKKELSAIQLSERKGFLQCVYLGERVEIGGKAVTFLEGFIQI